MTDLTASASAVVEFRILVAGCENGRFRCWYEAPLADIGALVIGSSLNKRPLMLVEHP